jgi:DNA helicase HerA-like ATPase
MTNTQSSVSASSPDGRQFRLDLGGVDGYAAGDFVTIAEDSGDRHLGLVEWLDQHAEGGGVATGSILSGWRGASVARPFTSAAATHSDPEVLAAFYRDASAFLGLGSMVSAPDVQVGLVPKRLNRHTFWCGQSGSGKTFALGVALEQILMHTRLPVLVLDPNGDFVRLGEIREGADEAERTALAARDIRVLRPGDGPDGLRIRFRDMSIRSKGAIFRLDPLIDHEAFNVLVRWGPQMHAASPEEILATLRAADDPGSRIVASRLENLGVTDWTLWALDKTAATDIIAERPAATVLDIGSFATQDEQLAVALAVFEDLWRRREERRPILIVVDEAHNLCSPDLESTAARAVRELIIQIAAEGRKFGLWLLLSTQRPSKVHPQIVSQCDNLMLMRMNSPNDLAELGDLFGFVPRGMLAQASRFRQGEALVAGGFVPAPSIIKFRDRITHEGGIDVPVPMPTP